MRITCWGFPKCYCESDNGSPLWVATVTRLERRLDAVQRTETLNPKTKRNTETHTHTHYKMNTRNNIKAQPSAYSPGPDVVLTMQGIQAWSTGYDTSSPLNRAWATFCQFYVREHFWFLLPITTKLNLFQMLPMMCWSQWQPLPLIIFRGRAAPETYIL